jgi:uncharacterized membrane protein YcaP (DUF421 family)
METIETIIVYFALSVARRAFGKEKEIGQIRALDTLWNKMIRIAILAASADRL